MAPPAFVPTDALAGGEPAPLPLRRLPSAKRDEVDALAVAAFAAVGECAVGPLPVDPMPSWTPGPNTAISSTGALRSATSASFSRADMGRTRPRLRGPLSLARIFSSEITARDESPRRKGTLRGVTAPLEIPLPLPVRTTRSFLRSGGTACWKEKPREYSESIMKKQSEEIQ